MLKILKTRFEENMHRHCGIAWSTIEALLESDRSLIDKLKYMESTGGEVDAAVLNGRLCFVDFSRETPSGRRNICYDAAARCARKKNPPENSAEEMAAACGARLMTADEYREIQRLEDLDTKTSTWLSTPESIRALGGAIFGDKRYGETFIYHNGADSYYSVRGVRFVMEAE